MNVSGFGNIVVVVGNAFLMNVASFGVVVGLGYRLRFDDFTEARAPK